MRDKQNKTKQAMRYRREASYQRSMKQDCNDQIAVAYDRAASEMMEVNPDSFMLISGEIAIIDLGYVNTLTEPDAAAEEASLERVELLGSARVTELGIDAANTIQAQNSIEKMLAHQMAVCHKTAMELIKEALNNNWEFRSEDANMESVIQTRKLNTANRLMQTYQQAMTALQKARSGGKKTMVVQHVDVRDGGQAIVAGGDAGRGNGEK